MIARNLDEAYSRQSKHHRAEYAWRRGDDSGQLRHKVAKPDGLTIGGVRAGLYFDQLVKKEVQFDWPKFTWLGSPTQVEQIMYIRANTSLQNNRRRAKVSRAAKMRHQRDVFNGLLHRKPAGGDAGSEIHTLTGYKDGPEVELAVEREEVLCRGISVETLFGREPLISWFKNGYIRVLMQTGKKRDPRLAEVPTIWELMNEHKTPDSGKRLATIILAVASVRPSLRQLAGAAGGPRKDSSGCFQKNVERPGFSGQCQRSEVGDRPRRMVRS